MADTKISVDQIQAYLRSDWSYGLAKTQPQSVMDQPQSVMDQATAQMVKDELTDDLSEASQDLRKLQPNVSYVELSKPVGELACGQCMYLRSDGVFCAHAEVRGNVNAENGHCNYWKPEPEGESLVVFPPKPGQMYTHVQDDEDDEDDEKGEHEEEDEAEDDESED